MSDAADGKLNRREFLSNVSLAGLGLALTRAGAGQSPTTATAENSTGPAVLRGGGSPGQVVRVALVGAGSRGNALARGFAAAAGVDVAWICDVDAKRRASTARNIEKIRGQAPEEVADFRTILDNTELDAVVIATASHWHAAAAILALKAGKHVYVEKPASHNARELDLLVEAQQRYGRLVQMGNQQRSHPETIEAIQRIHEGIIGRAYQARGWISMGRESIGRGKPAPVPEELDYDLWQGPAPRRPYQDNIIHYNWHWFRHWGGGELANNGTHEIDIARWALQVAYPEQVNFSGGRYHFEDDWEFADTQDATWDFNGKKSIVWQGRSCNPMPVYDRYRGISVHGTEGTMVIDREGYVLFDPKGKELERRMSPKDENAKARGIDGMSYLHIMNFVDAVRGNAQLNAEISDARKSVLLPHLGNIAQFHGRHLTLDPATGRIQNNAEAAGAWGREYEPGWEPTVG